MIPKFRSRPNRLKSLPILHLKLANQCRLQGIHNGTQHSQPSQKSGRISRRLSQSPTCRQQILMILRQTKVRDVAEAVGE